MSRTTVLSPAALTIGQNVSLSTSVTWPTTAAGPDVSKLDLTLTEYLKPLFFLVLLLIVFTNEKDRRRSPAMVDCLVGHEDSDPTEIDAVTGGGIGGRRWWICNAIVVTEDGNPGVFECVTEKVWW